MKEAQSLKQTTRGNSGKTPEDLNKNNSRKEKEKETERAERISKRNAQKAREETIIESGDEGDIDELPFKKVAPLTQPARERVRVDNTERSGRPIPDTTKRGPAYHMKAPIEKAEGAKDALTKLMESTVTIGVEDLLTVSEPMRKELIKMLAKRRVNPEQGTALLLEENVDQVIEEQILAELEERSDARAELDLREDAIRLEDLPPAAVLLSTSRQVGNIPANALIVDDPVLQYLDSLPQGSEPKQIVVAKDSQSLRSVFPFINGTKSEESVTDGGSQIISMAETTAKELGVMWDPDIRIHMQSANGQLEMTLGLARNIPFEFGKIKVYLQVHIISNPAYKVLLGRPFDVLTESVVQNTSDGGQIITIKDPNTGQRCTIPTFTRGVDPKVKSEERAADF